LVKSSKEVIKNKSSGVWICEIQHLYIPIVLEVGFPIKFAFYKEEIMKRAENLFEDLGYNTSFDGRNKK